jgi:predicted HD superfamily hydrolase involved in NAD metabolism
MIDRATAETMIAARLSAARLEHSHRVAAEAAELARRFGGGPVAAEIAGILHDYCRELEPGDMLAAARRHGLAVSPLERSRPVGLLHARVAAAELLEVGLVDTDTAGAIACHTVGGAGMTCLEKCVYLADFCEPGRDSPDIDAVRVVALTSLDGAVAAAARLSLLHLIERRRGVVPEALALYNELHA